MTADFALTRRRATLAIGAALATPSILIRNAWAEGKTITIGTYTGPQGEFVRTDVIPKFQADYGCQVLQTQGVTLGQISILRSQKANPAYSVMFMDDVGVPVAKAEDLIAPLPADKMPNLANVIPAFVLNDGYAAAFAVSIVTPYYNTDTVDAFESWQDLWLPKFKGRFMLITPKQTQSVQLLVAATALATGKPFKEAQYLIDQGWEKMAALRPNVQTIYDNNPGAVLQMAQGQADVAGPDFSKTVLPYASKGAPLAMSMPKEGVFGGVNTITIVKGGPNPDLAAAFANRMLDPTVQKGLSEATLAAPTVTGLSLSPVTAKVVPYPESRMKEMNLMTIDWSFINPKRNAIVEKYNQVFSG